MLVVMSTDFSINMRGFQANYWTSCGAAITVTDEPGVITSDSVYRHTQNICEWHFSAADPEQRIVLTFLEFYSSSDSCDNFIHIQNLPERIETSSPRPSSSSSSSARQVDMPCATDAHREPYVSVTNTLTMRVVRSHLATTDTFRFRVQYALITAGCNQRYHSKRGNIASPGFPGTYPLETDCEWLIDASSGNRLQLTFSALDIDATEHCNEAYVEVRERNAQGAMLGTFCGTDVPTTLRASSFWLKFHSGSEETGHGFQASYTYGE